MQNKSKMKNAFKILNLSLLAILICFLPSCASKGETHFPNEIFNGIEFTYLIDFTYKAKEYSIYSPVNIALIDDERSVKEQSLLYVYQPLEVPNVDDWRINYYYEYRCLSDNLTLDPELTKLLLDNMDEVLSKYEKTIEISFEKFKSLLNSTIDEFSQEVDFSKTEADMFTERDNKTEYDEAKAVTIKLNGTNARRSRLTLILAMQTLLSLRKNYT